MNTGDYDCRTAMHLAASCGRVDVVNFLVSHGARVDVKDRYNGTPLDDARRENHDEVARLLEERKLYAKTRYGSPC